MIQSVSSLSLKEKEIYLREFSFEIIELFMDLQVLMSELILTTNC